MIVRPRDVSLPYRVRWRLNADLYYVGMIANVSIWRAIMGSFLFRVLKSMSSSFRTLKHFSFGPIWVEWGDGAIVMRMQIYLLFQGIDWTDSRLSFAMPSVNCSWTIVMFDTVALSLNMCMTCDGIFELGDESLDDKYVWPNLGATEALMLERRIAFRNLVSHQISTLMTKDISPELSIGVPSTWKG